nr:hypothetical protein [Tanacetum cinerariifolium]
PRFEFHQTLTIAILLHFNLLNSRSKSCTGSSIKFNLASTRISSKAYIIGERHFLPYTASNSAHLVRNKLLKAFPLPVMKFPLPEYFLTASEDRFPLLSERDAPAEEVCTTDEVEVIEFGDSYEAPQEVSDTGSASEGSAKKKGKTVVVTAEDMQKRRNDVKARTTLLLALLDEHQLRFNKYKTAQELWAAILKTFCGNKATKKTKKNKLKQHSGKKEVTTASIPTASTQVSPASANVAAANFSHDTVCAYIASQSNGSQIKYEDINQIDEDNIKEMDIKPSPSIEGNSNDLQSSNSSISENGESFSSISSKPVIKFVKADDSPTGRIVRNKMLKALPLPVMKFLLPEYFPTASEDRFPLLSERDAPAEEVCTTDDVKV